MLIANTTDQKFLEAILAELKKTNGLLESLCPIAKDAGSKETKAPTTKKVVKSNGTLPKSTRSNNSNKSRCNSSGRASKRKAVPDSEHGGTTNVLPPGGNGNSGKRVSRTGRTGVSAEVHGEG